MYIKMRGNAGKCGEKSIKRFRSFMASVALMEMAFPSLSCSPSRQREVRSCQARNLVAGISFNSGTTELTFPSHSAMT